MMNRVLWIVQVLLALLFLFAGGSKLFMPAAQLTAHSSIPAWFFRFIGVVEVLGGLGLILPGMLRRHSWLTPLAAAGLLIIMVGAVAITVQTMGATVAIFPLVTALLTFFVAYGRWRLAPLDSQKVTG